MAKNVNYPKIGQEYLDKYEITLDVDSDCWSRAHAHCEKNDRRICKMDLPKTRFTLFDFLHEVGHIVHPQGAYPGSANPAKTRALAELNATEWAIAEMRDLGIPVPRRKVKAYNEYIADKLARGKRRGLKKVDPRLRRFNDPGYKPHRHKYNKPGGSGSFCECGAWTSGPRTSQSPTGASMERNDDEAPSN